MSAPVSPTPERITAAAILRMSDGHIFTLPPPARHPRLIDHIISTSNGTITRVVHGYKQGFVTTKDNRFVDRKEACSIARAAGQIKVKHGPTWLLYSEDLW